ncbi:MAG: flagellar basal body-associated FliL family protein [Pseudomonadota bacterium]
MSSDKNKDGDAKAKGKGGKMKKILLITVGGVVLIGAGVGGGIYASGMMGGDKKHEDPNRPKLVERSEEPAAEVGGEGGEAKEAPPKVGTVAVHSDTVPVDPKKFELTYIPLEASFTANLVDSEGFIQVGLSLSTYYDGKVVANVKRHMVPIRSAILLTLSEQQGAVLSTPEGKQALQKLLAKAINRVLREKEGFGGIENVYFTNLVVQ